MASLHLEARHSEHRETALGQYLAARPSERRRVATACLTAVWLACCCAGFAALNRYSTTSGPAGRASSAWPRGASLERSDQGPTVIMFAHPRCPCTRASLHELEALLAGQPAFGRVIVVFWLPEAAPQAWTQTDTVALARSLPGVDIVFDPGGRIAASFAAHTSGQVFAFSASGQQVFSGGITALRGHEGSNAGHEALDALGTGKLPTVSSSSVYGCSLDSDTVGAAPPSSASSPAVQPVDDRLPPPSDDEAAL